MLEAMTVVNTDVLGSRGRKTHREVRSEDEVQRGFQDRSHRRLTLKDKQELARSRDEKDVSKGGVTDTGCSGLGVL